MLVLGVASAVWVFMDLEVASAPSASQDYTEMALGVNMKVVYVAGGSFTMGVTSEQVSDACDNEKPAHQGKSFRLLYRCL